MGENLRNLETYTKLLQSNILNKFKGISILTAIANFTLSLQKSSQNYNEYFSRLINKNNLNISIINEFLQSQDSERLDLISKNIAEEILKTKIISDHGAIDYLNIFTLTISLGISIYLICIENQNKVRLRLFGSNPFFVFIYDINSKSIFVLNPTIAPESLLSLFTNELEISNLRLKIKKNHAYSGYNYYNAYNGHNANSETRYDETIGLDQYLKPAQSRQSCEKCRSVINQNFLCGFCSFKLCVNCAKRFPQQKCGNCFYYNKVDLQALINYTGNQTNSPNWNPASEFHGYQYQNINNSNAGICGQPYYPTNHPEYVQNQNHSPNFQKFPQVLNPTPAGPPDSFKIPSINGTPFVPPQIPNPSMNKNPPNIPAKSQDISSPTNNLTHNSFGNTINGSPGQIVNLPNKNLISQNYLAPNNSAHLAGSPLPNSALDNKKDLECKCDTNSNIIVAFHRNCGMINYGNCSEKIKKYFFTCEVEAPPTKKCDHINKKQKETICKICKHFTYKFAQQDIENSIINLVKTIK